MQELAQSAGDRTHSSYKSVRLFTLIPGVDGNDGGDMKKTSSAVAIPRLFLPCDCKCIRTVFLSTSVCLSVRPSVKRVDCDKTK